MSIRYVRVRDKSTKHEFDVLAERVNPKKHDVIDDTPRSRHQPPKPFVGKDGKSGKPQRKYSPRTKREELVAAAEAAGLEVSDDTTNKQLADALNKAHDDTVDETDTTVQ
ncbi:hypothetical protein [Microbacterium maritypicum]